MRVLMLSTDEDIFKKGSAVRARMVEYGKSVEELHIVVYTKGPTTNNQQPTTISERVFVYPTNTRFKPLYFFDAYKISKSLVVGRKLSVITTQDPFETGLVGYFLKRKFQLSLQIQAHTDFLSPYFWRESLKNKIRVLLGKWLIKRADSIRVVSQRIKDSLKSIVNGQMSKVVVRPIPIDIEKIKSAPINTELHKKYPNHDFIILMASRLTKEKNIGLAIEVMRDIVKKHPKTLLLIVGDGPKRSKLELGIMNYELGSNVKIELWTNDLVSYYKTADLFLLTSNYEGYGRTIVEAAAAGLPSVMTDVGLAGNFLVHNKNGLVVGVGDKDGLVEAIDDMILNKEI